MNRFVTTLTSTAVSLLCLGSLAHADVVAFEKILSGKYIGAVIYHGELSAPLPTYRAPDQAADVVPAVLSDM